MKPLKQAMLSQPLRANAGCYSLSNAQRQQWKTQGYLLLTDFFSAKEKTGIEEWCHTLENWPETPGKWMKYRK